MKLEIKKGKDMKSSSLRGFHKIINRAFTVTGSDSVMPKNRKNFAEDTFFVLHDKNKILSVARLRNASINFKGESYKIKGIADVVSVQKGKGHGKKVMKAMISYLNKNKEIGVGFCKRNNAGFYRKCGYKVAKNLAKRFIYKNSKGKIVKSYWDNDVIFNFRGKELINNIVRSPKEKVWISRRHW